MPSFSIFPSHSLELVELDNGLVDFLEVWDFDNGFEGFYKSYLWNEYYLSFQFDPSAKESNIRCLKMFFISKPKIIISKIHN